MHQRGHARREPRELLVERLHLVGPHAQHRVAVLAHLRERDLPPGRALGLLVVLVLVVLVLVVLVVVVLVVVHVLVAAHAGEFTAVA